MAYDDIRRIKVHLTDSSRKLADITAYFVYENPSLIKPLLEISWLDEEPMSQRASRVVSICCSTYPELILPYASRVIRHLIIQKSEGSRRNFLKIFADSEIPVKPKDKGVLLNACFDFLTGNFSIAVKVYSMEIIYRLSKELPDIRRELYELLADQIGDASAGYRSRATKIMKKIEKVPKTR